MKELIERLRKMQREGWATDNEIAAADALERLTHQIEQIKGIESGEMADLRQYQREYNELRKVIDNGSESATHASALYRVVEREEEIERRTAELARAKEYHAGELADVTAELAEMKAERDALSVAAALWNHRYIDACQQHADRQTNLGHEIVALGAELARAKEVMAHDREYIDELLGKLI